MSTNFIDSSKQAMECIAAKGVISEKQSEDIIKSIYALPASNAELLQLIFAAIITGVSDSLIDKVPIAVQTYLPPAGASGSLSPPAGAKRAIITPAKDIKWGLNGQDSGMVLFAAKNENFEIGGNLDMFRWFGDDGVEAAIAATFY